MRVGWAGFGRFGLPMVSRLQQLGHEIHVYDDGVHARPVIEALRAGGAQTLAAETPVDVLGLCLPTAADVSDVVSAVPFAVSATVVDFSTTDPDSASALAERLSAAKRRYLDAPVSGSIHAAGHGELTTWVGSGVLPADDVANILLTAVARHVQYLGQPGRGQAMKLVNQLIHIGNMAVLGEGLRLAERQGLDLGMAVDSLLNASADSAMLRRFGASIVASDFSLRYSVEHARKDIDAVLAVAGRLDTPTDITSMVASQLSELCDRRSGSDFSVLADPLANPESNRGGH